MKNRLPLFVTALLLGSLLAAPSLADVVISGTRVVFPAQQRDVTLRLENKGNLPALVQAWVDRGNPDSQPDTASAPFLVSPPLFRIDPHKAQSLRIIFTHATLPADRESLFWLNILEIPPKPSVEQLQGKKNYLQLAIRSRLKLFYRPAGLKGDPLKAPARVTWHAVGQGRDWALRVDNPSPYHITFVKVQIRIAGKTYTAGNGMVDPDASLTLKLKDLRKVPPAGSAVSYDIINDYGAITPFKGTVAP